MKLFAIVPLRRNVTDVEKWCKDEEGRGIVGRGGGGIIDMAGL